MADLPARMGEFAASADSDDVLVGLGLGSCIGLALIDRWAGVAGLAHIVLSKGEPNPQDPPVKYAPTAVPFLLERVISLGARKPRLQAVLVGGASMFATSNSSLEVGRRNEAAVREALARLRVNVTTAATGGKRGRTVRVYMSDGRVTSRVAGSPEEILLGAATIGVAA